MIRRRQRDSFRAELFDRLQRVTIIALRRFQLHNAFDLRLHLPLVAINATCGQRLFLFRLAVFQEKIRPRVGRLACRVAGEAILNACPDGFVVCFVAEGQRRFHAGLHRIQFGVDDLACEPERGKLGAFDRTAARRRLARRLMTARAVSRKCVFRIGPFWLRRADNLRLEVADETIRVPRRAHLHACREIDFCYGCLRLVFGVASGAFKLVFVEFLIGRRVFLRVVEFDAVFERSSGRVLLEEINVLGVRIIIVKLRRDFAGGIGEAANVGRHLPLINSHRVVADHAHVALNPRPGVGVAFDAGRMRSFGFQSEFATWIADVFDVALVFAQPVFDRGSVTIGAINLD